MKPRLHQPLFSKEHYPGRVELSLVMMDTVRAYDCIWTLLYSPNDVAKEDRRGNALANLDMLGACIEASLGPEVFAVDPRQLTFPDAIINCLEQQIDKTTFLEQQATIATNKGEALE